MRALVAGATGFVGKRLCPALREAGHEVVAMTRNPQRYNGVDEAVFGDVHQPDSLPSALQGCETAYYLVHSLDDPDFERLDAQAAEAFGRAAAEAGLTRIVFLGGLGSEFDELSAHLRSRREVEGLLGAGGVPVTTLRAGIIIGTGGLSWEITRQLVEHLPVMVTPRWVRTRTQPIALTDVVRYLAAVLEVPESAGRALEIGGPDVVSYLDLLRAVAEARSRPLLVVPVPLLSPHLSSLWLSLVTDVNARAGRALVDSMTNEAVVRDRSIHDLVPIEPIGLADAIWQALAERSGRAVP